MATIKDVAKRAKVSYTTVSHVINKTRFVSEDIVKRVKKAIDELGYRPNQVARCLRKQESKTIGVISSMNKDPYFATILSGIESSSAAADYNVIVCYSEMKDFKEKKNIEMLLDKGVDAIITHCTIENQRINELLRRDIPVLFIQHYLPGIKMDAFCTDDHKGGYLATRHLLEQGHTRIACIGGYGNDTYSYRARKSGWEQALQEAGIPVLAEYYLETHLCHKGGYEACTQLLSLPTPPTALFCYNDFQAIGAIRAAVDMHRLVPDDISIVGYDDIDLAPFTIPRLTTIAQPKEELGELALKRILARIKDKRIKPVLTMLQPELMIRESTAQIK